MNTLSASALLGGMLLPITAVANDAPAVNLLSLSPDRKIVLIGPDRADPLEEFAISELAAHVEKVTGSAPEIRKPADDSRDLLRSNAHLLVIGRIKSNSALGQLAQQGFFEANDEEQGHSLRVDANPNSPGGWLAVLCGADPRGVLYAVRDFTHYHLYREDAESLLRPAQVSLAPGLKVRMISESGCNLFSAENDRGGFMHRPGLNYFSRNVVFDKHYFVDWLSQWKVTHVNLVWSNYRPYHEATKDFIAYAHSRGVRVMVHIVPYRPLHEGPPPEITSVVPPSDAGDCPRDPKTRRWYTEHLTRMVTQEPRFDGVIIESPYHDGVYCPCSQCRGKENPYPESEILAEMTGIVRRLRPEMPIVRVMKQPVPDEATARRLAAELAPLEAEPDWHVNTFRNREHRRRWHELGPKFGTYLRLYRSALKGKNVATDIDFLYNDFRMSAERGVLAHGFCYRFYGGNYGSFTVEEDRKILERYPDRTGPLSLALVAEAAFDPFVEGEARFAKIRRIHATTIPDYPRGGAFDLDALRAALVAPPPSKLFRRQYRVHDKSFCHAQCAVDFLGNGRRQLLFASRKTGELQMLDAADGAVIWTKRLEGHQQSIAAYDLDGDGRPEILFTVSQPGRLYVLDSEGNLLRKWQTDDSKLGHSAVILDADRDGLLDGYFGSRYKYLFRMNMHDLTVIAKRSGWSQCGCYTTAMDVDRDGTWDLFAGAGDDRPNRKGVLHRYDPATLESIWSFATDDNASSADPVLVDLDGDAAVEIVKSVDNYAGDDAHDAVYAFRVDGTPLWKVEGLAGEDSPNVADLDGDGAVEIVGMTFGSEVYCLDHEGRTKWRKDLRPELDDRVHAYLTPILCDLNGDKQLEILALTNGGYFDSGGAGSGLEANGILFALSAAGDLLDRFDLGGPRYWGDAFYANLDDDPQMELVASGSGGLDVIETKGYGPRTEHFQRRRDYQRLNVVPWAYADSYFIYRGTKQAVQNLTDNLVLAKVDGRYAPSGKFTTERLALPPDCFFNAIHYRAETPPGTSLRVNVLDDAGTPIVEDVAGGQRLKIDQPVRLEFVLSSTDGTATPLLDAYRISFDRHSSE